MNPSDLERLTESQRACLRLIVAGYQAKQVATTLGISTAALNERLRAARRIMGTSSSRELALFLVAHEQPEPYKSPVNNPFVVTVQPFAPPSEPITRGEHRAAPLAELRETRAHFEVDGPSVAGRLAPLLKGIRRNDLTARQTILLIFALALSLLGAAAVMILTLVALAWLVFTAGHA